MARSSRIKAPGRMIEAIGGERVYRAPLMGVKFTRPVRPFIAINSS